MYKKIAISFLALILVFNFTMKDYADAAIASKAASQAAKQIAKEVIQDIAVETAANFALHQAMDIAGKYEAKQGYKIVCPDGSADCTKPIQVKENITDTDKQAIKGQAGTELDKLLNGGAGVPKWQKFLDWFLPVWLVSFGATALTYAFDSDVRSLFNEAGYNALVSLGIIVPITQLEASPLKDEEEPTVTDGKYAGDDGVQQNVHSSSSLRTGITAGSANDLNVGSSIPFKNLLIVSNLSGLDGSVNLYTYKDQGGENLYGFSNSGFLVGDTSYQTGSVGRSVVVNLDGQTVYSGSAFTYTSSGGITVPFGSAEIYPLLTKKLISIQYRTPYQIGSFWYTDMLYNTVDGRTIDVQLRSAGNVDSSLSKMNGTIEYTLNNPLSIKTSIYKNQIPLKRILVPTAQEIEQVPGTIQKSNYEDEKGHVALIPPTALTYKEEGTGETVYRVPAAIPTEPAQFQKEDGTIVPEENITVDPAPTVTPSPGGQTTPGGQPIPEGTPTVTPSPTPSNPTPGPIPLTPGATPTTPGETPPTEPPPTSFPDESGCEEGLKFPRYIPFMNTLSNAFPFSIPWDIQRALEAAFGGIGSERPSFELDLSLLGDKKTIEIGVPAFFDKWKPFTDGLLLLIFDVGIMFGIYRFMKGGGS